MDRITRRPEGLESEVFRTYAGLMPLDNAKTGEELGAEHRDFEAGLRDYLEGELGHLGEEQAVATLTSHAGILEPVS